MNIKTNEIMKTLKFIIAAASTIAIAATFILMAVHFGFEMH